MERTGNIRQDGVTTEAEGARVRVLCAEGERLSSQLQDTESFRYAVLNLGGRDDRDLHETFERISSQLRIEFEP